MNETVGKLASEIDRLAFAIHTLIVISAFSAGLLWGYIIWGVIL